MLTNILIGLLCYSVFLTLFLVGWHRHCKRMEAYDRSAEQDMRRMQHKHIASAGVRPFPE